MFIFPNEKTAVDLARASACPLQEKHFTHTKTSFSVDSLY